MFNKVINSLVQIFNENAYTNIVVSNTIKSSGFDDDSKRLYTRLVYGVVEKKLLIDYLMQPLTKGKRIKPYVKNALRVGGYALDNLNLAPYYIINELVEVVKKKDYKASTFVNAILRKYKDMPRRSFDNLSKLDYYSIKYSISKELTTLLYNQYQDRLEDFFKKENDYYNTYRINTLKISILDLINYLDNQKIEYEVIQDVVLQTKENLINSSLFTEGMIVPQDKSSIMVGLVANPKKGSKILDACSAPGSKAMHLASIMENEGSILATDIYQHKLKLIEENAKKLGVKIVNTKLSDASLENYHDEFDMILADVPCSGLGVIRHKPDLKYQMNNEKIASIIKIQEAILENVSKYVKKGGNLIYSTCTINKEENELMVEKFLNRHNNFKKVIDYLTLPSDKEDGFYICKLEAI